MVFVQRLKKEVTSALRTSAVRPSPHGPDLAAAASGLDDPENAVEATVRAVSGSTTFPSSVQTRSVVWPGSEASHGVIRYGPDSFVSIATASPDPTVESDSGSKDGRAGSRTEYGSRIDGRELSRSAGRLLQYRQTIRRGNAVTVVIGHRERLVPASPRAGGLENTPFTRGGHNRRQTGDGRPCPQHNIDPESHGATAIWAVSSPIATSD